VWCHSDSLRACEAILEAGFHAASYPVHMLGRDPAALVRHVEITSVEIIPGSDDDIDWDEAEWIDIED
jgi:hypothetical protein